MILDFNRSWRTFPTPEHEISHLPQPSREVDLPHDDNIRYDTAPDSPSSHAGAYYPACSTEYEKTLTLTEDWTGKRISLAFDGVYHNALVRVNQKFACRSHYGYTAFCCDLTPLLHSGENLIQVSAPNGDVPNSRWYTGTGIFREVQLLVQEHVFLPYRSAALRTELDGCNARVSARIPVCNETAEPARRQVRLTLTDDCGKTAAQGTVSVDVPPHDTAEAALTLSIEDAKLWSDTEPNLYQAQIALLQEDRIAECVSLAYGLRSLSFTPEQGFLLNGVPTKLRGGCIHHDNGILGGASYPSAEDRKIRAMKECGYNAIRCAHNPASDALLRACDKYGMLVMDEAFDMWREPKATYDNSLYFAYTWRTDLESMVNRDRNHACVILYSTGNEIPERDGHADGNRISRELADCLRMLDPTRPVIHALNNVSADGNANGLVANLLEEQDYFLAATEEFAKPLDVVGYNYMRDRLEKDHAVYPQRILCATETVGSDIFHGWDVVERCPWVIGDFLWTAVDYLGEVGLGRTEVDHRPLILAGYPFRLSGCGDLDICCRRKPRSYYRDCVWHRSTRPYLAVEDPALYDKTVYPMWWGWPLVQEYWNYPGWEGRPTHVTVYSTADEVALLINGREIGRAPAGKPQAYLARFELPYEKGTLTAVEYRQGQACASHSICTPDEKRVIRLSGAWPGSSEDGLLFVDAELTDGQGQLILENGRTVSFEVEGGAEFLAAGSGAICTTANYTSPVQPMEQGHVQLVLRRKHGQPEPVLVRCKSDGLPDAVLTLSQNT